MILCCKKQPDIFENFLGFDFMFSITTWKSVSGYILCGSKTTRAYVLSESC